MPVSLENAAAASLPPEGLAYLAPLRARADVRVLQAPGRTWAFWPEGDSEVVQRVLAITGAELFTRHDGRWHRLGHHLPAFDVPDDSAARPLPGALFPAPVRAEVSDARTWAPLPLSLVRDSRPRPATALRCPLRELLRWADAATTRQLAALTAAIGEGERTPPPNPLPEAERGSKISDEVSGSASSHRRSGSPSPLRGGWGEGSLALVRGERLPPLPAAERFWGRQVLVPLGFRPEPALAEGVLSAALCLSADDCAILGPEGVELLPAIAFTPVTRAGLRRAMP